MGLFDFFSEEAREKREQQKKAEIAEQERLQRAILDRRWNPEKMEEYHALKQQRRDLRMNGEDEAAEKIDMWTNEIGRAHV